MRLLHPQEFADRICSEQQKIGIDRKIITSHFHAVTLPFSRWWNSHKFRTCCTQTSSKRKSFPPSLPARRKPVSGYLRAMNHDNLLFILEACWRRNIGKLIFIGIRRRRPETIRSLAIYIMRKSEAVSVLVNRKILICLADLAIFGYRFCPGIRECAEPLYFCTKSRNNYYCSRDPFCQLVPEKHSYLPALRWFEQTVHKFSQIFIFLENLKPSREFALESERNKTT